jgi:hypothetical protein
LFDAGDLVYQGYGSYKQAEATVVEYDMLNHTLLIDDIKGLFKKNTPIFTQSGNQAMVINVGHAKTNIDVSGAALLSGRFVTEDSFLSSAFSVLQDSYYYQFFSYVISSQLESTKYENFVKKLIHPAGFVMFSDIEIISDVQTLINVENLDLDGDLEIISVAGIDGQDDLVIGVDDNVPMKTVIAWDDK